MSVVTPSKGPTTIQSPQCRVCLVSTRELINLNSDFEQFLSNKDKNKQKPPNTDGRSLLDILEQVTSGKVFFSEDLPNCICLRCTNSLKEAYIFISDFQANQHELEEQLGYSLVFTNNGTVVYGADDNGEETISIITKEEPLDYDEDDNNRINHQEFEYNDKVLIKEDMGEFDDNEGPMEEPEDTNDPTFDPSDDPSDDEYIPEPTPKKSRSKPGRLLKNGYEDIRHCNQCDFVSTSRGSWYSHKRKHSTTEPTVFICDTCGHSTHSRSSLYHHKLKHQGKPFECDKCPKRYETTSRLKEHMRKHENSRDFLCQVCGKAFNFAMSLRYHMRLHMDKDKGFSCSICGLVYRLEETLQRHVRIHTRQKPFKCEFCDKCFATSGDRACHQRTHTNQKPFACEYCGKAYVSKGLLRYHMGTHPGDHECYLCERSYLKVSFLDRHLKKVHGLDGQ